MCKTVKKKNLSKREKKKQKLDKNAGEVEKKRRTGREELIGDRCIFTTTDDARGAV
jgi:hypothetical protein